jgi:hypothetical protein
MPFRYEGKCGQHCGTKIHVNSKLGFFEWSMLDRRGATKHLWQVFGVVGFMGMLHGIDQFSVTALFFKKALLL